MLSDKKCAFVFLSNGCGYSWCTLKYIIGQFKELSSGKKIEPVLKSRYMCFSLISHGDSTGCLFKKNKPETKHVHNIIRNIQNTVEGETHICSSKNPALR
jgi:hypothetical protein